MSFKKAFKWVSGKVGDALNWIDDQTIGFFTKAAERSGNAFLQQTFGSGASEFTKAEADRAYKNYLEERAIAEQWRKEDQSTAERWRTEDISREERWRQEDIQRNSLAHRMQEAKEAGLHTATVGHMGTGGVSSPSMGRHNVTQSGGRVQPPRPSRGEGSHDPSRIPIEMVGIMSQMMTDKANQQVLMNQAGLIGEETENLKIRNKHQDSREIAEIALIKAQKESSDIMDKLTEAQRKELEHNLNKSIKLGIRSNNTNPIGMVYDTIVGTLADSMDENELKEFASKMAESITSLMNIAENNPALKILNKVGSWLK